jgi:hypothetical protein
VLESPLMNERENRIAALKIDLKSGLYSINEVRRKLGEPERLEPDADLLITWTTANGWVRLGTTERVAFSVTALLPEAFNGNVD